MATSNAAPMFRNAEHAGECILENHCYSFPDTETSSMMPPTFTAKYPEPVDERTGEIVKKNSILTKQEENRFTGLTRNASGEEAEYAVFKVFEQLVKGENNPSLLVIRNYVLQNFQANIAALQFGINFDGIHTVAEFDTMVFVKDAGLVLVEVKRQCTKEQLVKAEIQLQNGKLFFERIMSHMSSSACQLPVVKVIVFAEEESTSPTTKSDQNTYIVNKDLLLNFDGIWKEIIDELHTFKSSSEFAANDFRRFVRIATGIWCVERYQKRFYKYNDDKASASIILQNNDDMINRGIITSDVSKTKSKIVEPVADVELCRPQNGFPSCSALDLIYLTPEQKNLYQNFPKAIVRGPAGSGKTLVSNLKIVSILQNHPNKNILIISPDPHHLRMEQFVKSNGGQTILTKTFPPPENNIVAIITLADFFKVSSETLRGYDVSKYHVFIDDLQSLRLRSTRRLYSANFEDVVEFLERSYLNIMETDVIFWCAVDVAQSKYVDVKNTPVASLFNTDLTIPRQLVIPVFNLSKTLRNSVEISKVALKVREIRASGIGASSTILNNCSTGHRIRSESVTYHKITTWTSTDNEGKDWWKHGVGFAVQRVKEEIVLLLKPQDNRIKLSEIAVLSDGKIKKPVIDMLLGSFNITPQTIKQCILTNNDTIILDSTENVASFECACVFYLCNNNKSDYCFHYNIMTRARTKLVVVDFDREQRPPFLADDVIMIRWMEKDGSFCRL